MFGLVNLTGLKVRYFSYITQCFNRRIKAQCNPINNGLVLLCESNGSYKSIKVEIFKKEIYKDLNCQI